MSMITQRTPYLIVLMILLISFSILSAQETSPVSITFGTTTYMVGRAEKYDATSSAMEELAFFQKHFSTTSYSEYRSLYYNNSCIASEEEFASWHDHLKDKVIIPEAIYSMHTETDTLAVISYSITSGMVKQFFPLAIQKKNNQWYLLDLRKSEAMLNMKMYMTFVDPAFLHAFLAEPEKLKNQYISTLYTSGQSLNGDLMMNYYQDRYDPSARHYDLSRKTFHDVAVLSADGADQVVAGIQQLAKEYNIADDKKTLLDNLAKEGNYSMALSKIAEWSNTFDVVEITDKFYSHIKTNANDH